MPDLPRPCLMVLTDRTLLTPNWALAQAVAPAIMGGANFVVFREADLPPVPRASVFRFVRDGVRSRVPLVIQGTPETALRLEADGVHLENVQATTTEAREQLGVDRWVGRTVTTLDDAAHAGHTDYGVIHLDWSDPAAALRVVEHYVAVSRVPLVAGSDVPVEYAAECLKAGASGVGIMLAAMAAYDRTSAVRQYADALGLRVT